MIEFQNSFQGKADEKEAANTDSPLRKAAIMLSKAIIHLCSEIDKNLSEKLQAHNLHVLSQLGQVETKQQQMTYRIEALIKKLDDLGSFKDLLEQEGQSKRILTTQHYEEHIIQPMAKTLAPIGDMVEDAQKTLRSKQDQANDRCVDLVDAIYSQLKQFFINYGIESIRHRPNTKFNPRLMKPIKIVPTTNMELDGCVAESLLAGLLFGKDRLVRPESVSLYRYEAVHETETLTLNERRDTNVTPRN
jgi:molecular chaperone GrpE (heat shock protein)